MREPRFAPPLDVSRFVGLRTCCRRLLGAVCRLRHLVTRFRRARSFSLFCRVCALLLLLLLLWGAGAKPGLHLMYMAPT